MRSCVPPIRTFEASIERFNMYTGIRYPASEWCLGTTTISPFRRMIDIDAPFERHRFRLDMFHEQLPLPVPCYDLLPVIEFTVAPRKAECRVLPTSLS